MNKVVSVTSTKGGVGKSTMSRLMASVLEERGHSVCIIDLCPNSSITIGFFEDRDSFEYYGYDWLTGMVKASDVIQQVRDKDIYYIPSDTRIDFYCDYVKKKASRLQQLDVFKEKIEPLKKIFDYIIIDTHPNENSDLSNYAIAASDYSLIVGEVDLDSKYALKRTAEIIIDYQKGGYEVDYGLLFNRLDTTKAMKYYDLLRKEMVAIGVPEEKLLGFVRASFLVQSFKFDGKMLNESDKKWAKKVMDDVRAVVDIIF